MWVQRVSYGFSLTLPAPRAWAYRWATDYQASDLELMGARARRRVAKLAPDLVLLTDSFRADPFDPRPGRRSVKQKLVHLYPGRWAWVSTHVSGPAMYSQFVYELLPRGRRSCRLRFTGTQVERVRNRPTSRSVSMRARALRREDAVGWRRFAQAIRRDYRPARNRRH